MVDYKHNCIFIHIPKTGGTSVEHAFGFDYAMLGDRKHQTPQECIAEVGREIWDRYFKFTFIRNPWDRMVSWWMYTVHFSGNRERIETLEDMLGLGEQNHIFGGHDTWLEGFNFDFIGHYERLSDDFKKICRLIGVDVELPWHMKSAHAHYSCYYTETTIEWVRKRELPFIARFGYSFTHV